MMNKLFVTCMQAEEDRVVIIRFGRDWDETCMQMDEVSYSKSSCCLPADFPTHR